MSTLSSRLRKANRWREDYNPLRGMTLARAVTLIEQWNRGDFADLQWAYYHAEQADPDCVALVERRTSAMTSLDWQIKRVPQDRRTKGWSQELENEQAAALREAYERVDNLPDAIDHLALATFRGFSHLEKHRQVDGSVFHLEPLDQWNVVRHGLRGPWKYNPDATNTRFENLPEANVLDPAHWVIREKVRHVDRIALVKYVRQCLGQKDWDSFIEIYGIPGVIIIAPPGMTPDQETAFESAASDAAEGGSGVLPNGSDVKTSDSPRGVNPFRDHLRYLQEQLVLVGTGGLLTMLTESGSGTLAGGAHQTAFDTIARAEGRMISSCFQRAIDSEVLRHHFGDAPRCVYFELSGQDKVDVSQVVDQIAKLSAAGFELDAAEASELTGFKLQKKAPAPAGAPGLFANRAPSTPATLTAENAVPRLARAFAEDLQPIRKRLERIMQISDPDILRNRLAALRDELPQLLDDINADPSAARVLEDITSDAVIHGAAQSAEAKAKGVK